MDDKSKARYETTLKVLGWGMTVYLLILGYSITQSGLFELRADSTEETNFDIARMDYAQELANKRGVSSEEAKNKADAEKIRLEVYQDKEKRNDAWSRGLGLVLGALSFSIAFPLAVRKVSERYKVKVSDDDDDNPILDYALTFSIIMSVVTLGLACLTAFF